MTRSALVLVDIQNDFVPGGALPTKEGQVVVPVANRLVQKFELVVATQDWHPPDHGSFASNHEGRTPGEVVELAGLEQVLWPDHCVQGTVGAELHPDLDRDRIDAVIRKGEDPAIDSYSGFFDNGHRKATGLKNWLDEREVKRVYVCGLATDYCVKYTVLDAIELGLETWVVTDACRGVDLNPGDIENALEEMERAGARLVASEEIE